MTEDEATKKTCPIMHPERSKYDGSNVQPTCVASQCMAWRWDKSRRPMEPPPGSTDFALGVLGTAEQRAAVQAKVNASRHGYCGLAGQEGL